jgi:hypothetical protein
MMINWNFYDAPDPFTPELFVFAFDLSISGLPYVIVFDCLFISLALSCLVFSYSVLAFFPITVCYQHHHTDHCATKHIMSQSRGVLPR